MRTVAMRSFRLGLTYPLFVGGVASALLVAPVGIGGTFLYGALLIVGAVVAVTTFVADRLLRLAARRVGRGTGQPWVPVAASALGIAVGWWTITYAMGGPTAA
jgi:hypothetical protein